MNTVKVKWDMLEIAFERNSPDLHSYIDRESGDVVVVVDGLSEDEENHRRISDTPERFIKIEPASSREQYRWMEVFVVTLESSDLKGRLRLAIDGKGAFRRFKDILTHYPVERERWFSFRGEHLHYLINQWFISKNITPDPPAPWGDVPPPPEPAELLSMDTADGPSPADSFRKEIKTLVDQLPACELPAARTFLEFLKDRGVADLDLHEPPKRTV